MSRYYAEKDYDTGPQQWREHSACCQHCRDFGRLHPLGGSDDNHEHHEARCYTRDCPGSRPVDHV